MTKEPEFEFMIYCDNCGCTFKASAPKFTRITYANGSAGRYFGAWRTDSFGECYEIAKRFSCERCGNGDHLEVKPS